MRIGIVTLVLTLALATTALADVRVQVNSDRESRYDYNVEFDWLQQDPFGLGSTNDRGGFRAFIPSGRQGREYYGSSSGYSGGRPGRVYDGRPRSGYRDGRGYDGYSDNSLRRRYWRPGAYTVLEGPGFYFERGSGYPHYNSSPTYIFPGNSPVIIDNNASYDYTLPMPSRGPLPPQYRGGDVYNDNRVYDSSETTTINNYGDQRAEPSRPQPQQAKPKVENIGPAAPVPPQDQTYVRPFGTRFTKQARVNTPGGPRIFKVEDGTLSTIDADGKLTQIAKDVDAEFGGFALMQPSIGTAVIFRQGGSIAAAYPTEKGWWLEALPYDVDFSVAPSIGMVQNDPWVTFSATDGTRWVLSFSGHQWIEIGSGTR